MKITKDTLKKIIKEELEEIMATENQGSVSSPEEALYQLKHRFKLAFNNAVLTPDLGEISGRRGARGIALDLTGPNGIPESDPRHQLLLQVLKKIDEIEEILGQLR